MNTIIFFGTDEFAVHILSLLLENGIDVKAVVTKPDRVKSRNKKMLPPPLKKFLLDSGVDLPLYQPEKASTSEFAEILRGYDSDLFVVVSYGEIINEELLKIPRLMPINIHPSLLPKYRGASPLRSALLHGDTEIGIAIIEMVKAMDAGDLVKMEKMKVYPYENHSALQERMFERAGILLLNCLKDFEEGNIKKIPQEGVVTFTKKFTKNDLLIDWNSGVDEVINKIRAYGSAPGAFCYVEINGKRLSMKILDAKKVSEEGSSVIKTISFTKSEGWTLSLRDGMLQILQLQVENKRLTNVKDFINGARGIAPTLLLH